MITTSCNHTHFVRINLEPDEQWIEPARHNGGKPMVVETITTGAEPYEMPESVKLHGHYAKKDGTPSQSEVSWPPAKRLVDLPAPIQNAIRQAFLEARH